jgi:hypothetical protein
LLSANMGTNEALVVVTFSEPLDPSTATHLAHYGISNESGEVLSILSAVLTNGTNVMLATLPRTNGSRFILNVEGVRDTAARGNALLDQRRIGYEILHLPWEWVWRYDESGADLGTAWREPGYDDSTWPSGPSLLGFEESPLPEPIRTQLIPPEYRGPVYYFRTYFPFTPHPDAATVSLRYILDDGAVFFLNGVEIHRVAVPIGQNSQTLATRTVEATVEGPYEIPAGAFLNGNNSLTAEVHQNSPISADVVFGAQITEAVDVATPAIVRPRLRFSHSGGQLEMRWEPGAAILECAESLTGPWQRAPNPTIPYSAALSGAARFYRLRQ